MTAAWEPTEPDLRPGDMTDEEADALLDHTLATVNRAREQLGLEPLVWSEDTEG